MNGTIMDINALISALTSPFAEKAFGGASGGLLSALVRKVGYKKIFLYTFVGFMSSINTTDLIAGWVHMPPSIGLSCLIGFFSFAVLMAATEIDWKALIIKRFK